MLIARAGPDAMPGLNSSIDQFTRYAEARGLPVEIVEHPTGPRLQNSPLAVVDCPRIRSTPQRRQYVPPGRNPLSTNDLDALTEVGTSFAPNIVADFPHLM